MDKIKLLDPYLNLTEDECKIIKQTEHFKFSYLSKAERKADIHPVRTEPKIGRNELCPCNSKKKYKKCCLKL